jgi:hypothetical protein
MPRSTWMLRSAVLIVGAWALACKQQPSSQTTTAGGTVLPSNPAPGAASSTAGPQTARVDLSDAAKTAHAWQGDATLCWVSTIMADPDGKTPQLAGWDYRFCSQATGQQYAVARMPAGFNGHVVGKADRPPVPDDFIDSDQAMAAAKSAGYAPTGTSTMSLDPGPNNKGFVWTVYSGAGTGPQFVIDAKTGTVVSGGK